MYSQFISSFLHSTIIPERLDAFINKYAEHTHDRWAFEKVSLGTSPDTDEVPVCFEWSVIMISTVIWTLRFRTTGPMERCWMRILRPTRCSDLTKHSLKRYVSFNVNPNNVLWRQRHELTTV